MNILKGPVILTIFAIVISLFLSYLIIVQVKPGEKVADTMLGTGDSNQALIWGVGGLDEALGSTTATEK